MFLLVGNVWKFHLISFSDRIRHGGVFNGTRRLFDDSTYGILGNNDAGWVEGKWAYIISVFDPSGEGTLTSYLNGIKVEEHIVGNTCREYVSDRSLGQWGYSNYRLNGYIGNYHVYGRALSADEIMDNYNFFREKI